MDTRENAALSCTSVWGSCRPAQSYRCYCAGEISRARSINSNWNYHRACTQSYLEVRNGGMMAAINIWDPSARLGGLRRFAVAITVLNILGHTFFGFEQSLAQPLVALATAYPLALLLE